MTQDEASRIRSALVVRPKTARQMLGGCGKERLYQLLNSGEIESFRDGRARFILVNSIHDFIDRRLCTHRSAEPLTTNQGFGKVPKTNHA